MYEREDFLAAERRRRTKEREEERKREKKGSTENNPRRTFFSLHLAKQPRVYRFQMTYDLLVRFIRPTPPPLPPPPSPPLPLMLLTAPHRLQHTKPWFLRAVPSAMRSASGRMRQRNKKRRAHEQRKRNANCCHCQ